MTMQDPASLPLLEVEGLSLSFGGVRALDAVSFSLSAGQIVGLIGPNGAGKTTLFNCLTRIYRPQDGDIRFDGQSILDRSAHEIAALGMTRTFQNLALFRSMTVVENVMVGGHTRTASGFIDNALRFKTALHEERALHDQAKILLDYMGLSKEAETPVGSLPFGSQKRVEIARALIAEPRLLLLDEPAGGLNHEEVEHLGDLISDIRDNRSTTVLLVEHHMNLVMRVSNKIVTLDFGRRIAEGSPEEIKAHPEVIRAYLGTAH
jgi:branched-chain amino acid transport system ATP-binding protein